MASTVARSGSDVEQRARGTTVSVDDSETWVESKRYTVYKASVVTRDDQCN